MMLTYLRLAITQTMATSITSSPWRFHQMKKTSLATEAHWITPPSTNNARSRRQCELMRRPRGDASALRMN